MILKTKELKDLVKAHLIVLGGNWIGLHPLSEVIQDDKHMLAFACFIVEYGAAFSFFYVYLMIHGHEIAKGFGVFQGYLFGSSVSDPAWEQDLAFCILVLLQIGQRGSLGKCVKGL